MQEKGPKRPAPNLLLCSSDENMGASVPAPQAVQTGLPEAEQCPMARQLQVMATSSAEEPTKLLEACLRQLCHGGALIHSNVCGSWGQLCCQQSGCQATSPAQSLSVSD